ncbi:amino acid ABC transporter permease [Oceanibacterium hippocampi]|uniref:Putative glutamine ABC transporter permease protein GlnM n=1 Tax=Oceanibacterium hippocampi TaxID=745714 RepID=A0A1Y5SVZ0_9PROT|nr:amino acid ABC transporter permease [Oceanibacterium hippocampi]SLN49898.1 putative glutamine ABC transporter permease protein GlnM [Oceanibacterium hippocampi]
MATELHAVEAERPTAWRDPKIRAIIYQAIVVILFVLFAVYIVHNTAVNLERLGIASGFGFLEQTAGFDLQNDVTGYVTGQGTHLDVLISGAINTLRVAAVGIFLATLLGFIVGVLRLSSNWVVNRLAYVYIEIVRNIPLLLQLLVWYIVVILSQPNVRQAINVGDGVYLSNRGLYVPAVVPEAGFAAIPIALAVGLVLAWGFARFARKRQEATGQILPVIPVNLALVIGLPVIAALATGLPYSFDYPELKGFNFQGGWWLTPEFTALVLGLSVYTGAFIAETVRAGIQSVSKGQSEAAHALGIKPSWTMRLVIIPQALRVIIPPLTSQYLNLTKNSSLAVVVAYGDIVALFSGTSLNQTGQAVEIIAITMLFYVTISLLISLFMNWYNKRMALVER